MLDSIDNKIDWIFHELVDFRRDLHMYPELSFKEFETTKKIKSFLSNIDVKVIDNIGGNGIKATLKGGKKGKHIAFRADFDALPIQEENNIPYKSKNKGVMHACGHDLHTASLLGLAKILSEEKDQISGKVSFIFQHAEEQIPGGAISMVEAGCLENIDEIYGAHIWSSLPLGKIGFLFGASMASGDTFDIIINGKGGHGGKPHETIDPILIGTHLVNKINHLTNREIDSHSTAVVSIGSFQSGDTHNVIPSNAVIKGTVRTFDENIRDFIEERIKLLCETMGSFYHCKIDVKYTRGYPTLVNDPRYVNKVIDIAEDYFELDDILRLEKPSMAMEDFAYFLQHRPGCYFYIGGANPEIGANFPHHHPRFNLDENSIKNVIKLNYGIVKNNSVDLKA